MQETQGWQISRQCAFVGVSPATTRGRQLEEVRPAPVRCRSWLWRPVRRRGGHVESRRMRRWARGVG